MYDQNKIPIVVGVTGHRDIEAAETARLKETVKNRLRIIKNTYFNSPVIMLNSCAAGADILCAEAAIEENIPLICALPMARDDYRQDFSADEASRFDAVLSAAYEVFAVNNEAVMPGEPRDRFYRQAGIYMAEHSQLLLALWDGYAGRADGCGTAEAVGFMLHPEHGGAVLSQRSAAVIHIGAARRGRCAVEPFSETVLQAGSVPAENSLRAIDKANSRLAQSYAAAAAAEPPAVGKKLTAVYERADVLALGRQRAYRVTLLSMAFLCSALVLALLMYDEFESNVFLPVYALLLTAAGMVLANEKRKAFHGEYMLWRMLSEALRAEKNYMLCGCTDNVCDMFSWTQRYESLWIREATASLLIGHIEPAEISPARIKEEWIDDQLRYHRRAADSSGCALQKKEKICNILTALSAGTFILIFALEFIYPDFMAAEIPTAALRRLLMMHPGQQVTVRGLFKIALGVVSAAALFFSGYYDRLSLDRKSEDHEKRAALYELAAMRIEEKNIDIEKLCRELAREELIETGVWYSYCKENRPGLDL